MIVRIRHDKILAIRGEVSDCGAAQVVEGVARWIK